MLNSGIRKPRMPVVQGDVISLLLKRESEEGWGWATSRIGG
jgi:hypothetical protein